MAVLPTSKITIPTAMSAPRADRAAHGHGRQLDTRRLTKKASMQATPTQVNSQERWAQRRARGDKSSGREAKNASDITKEVHHNRRPPGFISLSGPSRSRSERCRTAPVSTAAKASATAATPAARS